MSVGTSSLKSHTRGRFEWTVPDIFSYTEADEWIESPFFVIFDSKWYLRMCPYGDTLDGKEGFVYLYLYRNKDSLPSRRAEFTLSVKTSEGKIAKEVKLSEEFEKDLLQGYGCPYFLERSKLLRRRKELAPSKALTVMCTLSLDEGFDDVVVDLSHSPGLVRLSKDLKEMFTSGKGSDVTVTVKGETFSVHRNIVESRSPVFAAMFEADMKEKQTGTVDIVDCDPEAFRNFLLYLYSAKTEKLPKKVFQLYRIADKYDVQGLKSHCLNHMMNNFSCENIFDALLLASQFNEERLRDKAQVFFNENFKSIARTDRWMSFAMENFSVANDMLVRMSEK